MVDYSDAFNAGLEAARKAEIAKEEIESVFKELNKALKEVSQGNVELRREKFVEKIKEPSFFDTMAVNMFKPEKKETFWAIVAFNPRFPGNRGRRLARWTQERAGYPCKIVWGNVQHTCEDREALERSLAELLQDPFVGEQMIALMRMGKENTGEK